MADSPFEPMPGEGRDATREEKIARNEARFRAANDKIERSGKSLGADEIPFLCECGNGRCTDPIVLTRGDYEKVRAHPAHFVIIRGHEYLEAEVVVGEEDGYLIVEKTDRSRQLVEALDPRSHDS